MGQDTNVKKTSKETHKCERNLQKRPTCVIETYKIDPRMKNKDLEKRPTLVNETHKIQDTSPTNEACHASTISDSIHE